MKILGNGIIAAVFAEVAIDCSEASNMILLSKLLFAAAAVMAIIAVFEAAKEAVNK